MRVQRNVLTRAPPGTVIGTPIFPFMARRVCHHLCLLPHMRQGHTIHLVIALAHLEGRRSGRYGSGPRFIVPAKTVRAAWDGIVLRTVERPRQSLCVRSEFCRGMG